MYFKRRQLGAEGSGGMLAGAARGHRGPPPKASDWGDAGCVKRTTLSLCLFCAYTRSPSCFLPLPVTLAPCFVLSLTRTHSLSVFVSLLLSLSLSFLFSFSFSLSLARSLALFLSRPSLALALAYIHNAFLHTFDTLAYATRFLLHTQRVHTLAYATRFLFRSL